MPARRRIVLSCVILCLAAVFAAPGRPATVVRKPAWAGTFYAGTAAELTRQIEGLLAAARALPGAQRPTGRLRALIMPHAGYRYSGLTAACAALAIPPNGFERVVLIGPDHRVGFSGAAITAASHWQTPLGLVPIGRVDDGLPDRTGAFTAIPASDRKEHSLEVIVPFLQTRLDHFELIPVVLGPCDEKRMAAAIAPLVAVPRTLMVVSADLSHYLPAETAETRDRQTLARILALDPRWQTNQENRTCGRHSVGVLLELARRYNWQANLLDYRHSGDATGDDTAVVGYGAVAFYGDDPMQQHTDPGASLSTDQGAALVALARQTLARHFDATHASKSRHDLDERLQDPALNARCGTFVTLKIDNQLRGCIGSLSANAPIVDGVRDNAINAAFHDPRFPPLGRDELARVAIEVSVLSPPEPLAYSDGDDLLAKLRPGIDGVIIRKGYASATFLPQVWEQLPGPAQFLSHLCMKAGLPAGQWRQGDLDVHVYQVQYFEERD